MEKYCLFLETGPRRQGDSLCYCAVGVNFYFVGEGRESCRTCPIAHLGESLLCEHLDVYTFLQVSRKGTRSVKVEMECRLGAGQSPDSVRCDICPEMQDASPEGVPRLVSLGDVRWSKE